MQIEFDLVNSETIVHLDAEQMGLILFALDMLAINSINPQYKKDATALHDELTKPEVVII
jgi:hypothetical protein